MTVSIQQVEIRMNQRVLGVLGELIDLIGKPRVQLGMPIGDVQSIIDSRFRLAGNKGIHHASLKHFVFAFDDFKALPGKLCQFLQGHGVVAPSTAFLIEVYLDLTIGNVSRPRRDNGDMEFHRKPINDAQRAVLQWIGDGCPSGVYPPDDSAHFSSALALRNCGLIKASGHGRNWSASITDDGRHYLEHGSYPGQPPMASGNPTRQMRPKQPENVGTPANLPPRTTDDPKETSSATAASATDAQAVPTPSRIRRPHPAIRELMEHRKRLDVPTEQQRRALLILHALVREAIRRGWTVKANPSTYETDQWTGRRRSVSPGPDLFTVDAGDAPVSIRIRMKNKRVDHVPTQEELERAKRWSWPYPAYDYVPTEKMQRPAWDSRIV